MQSFTSVFISILLPQLFTFILKNKSDVNYVVSSVDNRKYLVQNHHINNKLQIISHH